MTQYISKAALVAEIERLISIANSQYDLVGNEDIRNRILWSQQASVCSQILSFLDTLEVKEVDSTDAFIERACDAYCKVCGHYAHDVPTHICRHDCRYFSDFANYMKGE